MAIKVCNCAHKELIHVGMVIDKFVKETSYDDYFYALVWTGTEAVEMQYETTAYGSCVDCGGRGEATIDASDDVIASYHTFAAAKQSVINANDMHYGRLLPRTGDEVLVVRGRKVAKGTQGRCSAVRATQYGHMVCLVGSFGNVWVDSKNLAPV